MKGRHELKFYINHLDRIELRTKLRAFAKSDENATDGGYKIRSLYFDNYMDKAVHEKLSGQSKREKFRLRYYNNDTSFIRLEKKSKSNQLVYKEDAAITAQQCNDLLANNYNFLKLSKHSLFKELYTKIRHQLLQPKNIVDYYREVYIYATGNVRITIDSHIKTSNNVAGFLNQELITVPAANAIILEVKYDGFIPDVIRNIVQLDSRHQTEFSKYVVARFV